MITKDRKLPIDHDLVVGHTYEVVVRAVAADGRMQDAEVAPRATIMLAGVTTGPMAPSALVAAPFLYTVFLTWVNPTDSDFDVTEIWRHTSDDRASATKLGEMRTESFADNLGASGLTRYYWIRSRNTSGVVSEWNATAGVGATTVGVGATDIDNFSITATKMFTNTIILSGDVWTNNSPSAGYIAWGAHTLVHNGVAYNISASNTSLRYVYWVVGGTTYSKSATHPTLGSTGFMVATNEAGVTQMVWNSSANMVIGTAFIMDAAITNAKIGALAVGEANIANLAVTDAKIDGLSVGKISAGTIYSKAIVLAVIGGNGDVSISAGKTDFDNTVAGLILGVDDSDSDRAKLYVGDANNYINWTGLALNVKGVITVTAGSNVAAGADVTSAALQAGTTISGGGIILSGGGSIHTVNKDGYADATAGIWLGFEGAVYTLGIGDSTKFITWDGSVLTVQGTIQTAASGGRILISGGDHHVAGYDTDGNKTLDLDADDPSLHLYTTANRDTALGDGHLKLESDEDSISMLWVNGKATNLTDTVLIDNVSTGSPTTHFLLRVVDNVTDRFRVREDGLVYGGGNASFAGYVAASSSGFYCNNVKVVGTQGAHVADATDAASAIARLNELFSRLETHGLLASA